LLAYRIPREPSTPRIAVWRKLRKLGVAQIGDGLVALPADARTIEALEWVADDIVTAGGGASLWRATLTSRSSEREVVTAMVAARAAEYETLAAKAEAALVATAAPSHAEGIRRLRLLRRELHGIQRRDFFPPPQQQRANAAITALAERLHQAQPPPLTATTDAEATAP
jgi:Protein ChrB, N-terminal